MKIIQETYDLRTVCFGWIQILFFWKLENCWNYKEIIEFSQESTILGKLQWSRDKFEPKLSKLVQFWSGEICKLLSHLMFKHPVHTLKIIPFQNSFLNISKCLVRSAKRHLWKSLLVFLFCPHCPYCSHYPLPPFQMFSKWLYLAGSY